MSTPGIVVPSSVATLAPIRAAVDAMAAIPGAPPVNGLAPGLVVPSPTPPGWVSATALSSGAAVDPLIRAAVMRWRGSVHAAAALAWKSYTYWLVLPAVVGFAATRRVPLLRPDVVVARWAPHQPFLTLGLLPSTEVAVLPEDPLAQLDPGVRVVPDDAALLAAMRESLKDDHLTPLLDQITDRVRIGRRTLWGSLASGVAHALSRSAPVIPGPTVDTAGRILAALGVDDLVDLAPRENGAPGLEIQRRTCCLAFTLPEPKICTGCCIGPSTA